MHFFIIIIIKKSEASQFCDQHTQQNQAIIHLIFNLIFKFKKNRVREERKKNKGLVL